MSNHDKIILQPKYVADFQCDGSKCNAKCCRSNWRIEIDVDTYKKYQRIKNPAMRKKILSSIQPSTDRTGFEIRLNMLGDCPLQCDGTLCYVQRSIGEDALSVTCKTYPRVALQIGNYQFRLLSMTCPVAAEQALFSSNAMELQQIDCEKDTAAWALTTKFCNVKNVSDDLVAIHIVMGGLSILQNTAYRFEQRLVLLGLFLDRVEDSQQDVDAVAELIEYYNSDIFQQEISGLWENWQHYPTAHRQLLVGIFKVLQQEKKISSIVPLMPILTDDYDKLYQDKHQAIQEHIGKVLEHYWQQEWLYHAFPYAFDGSLMHNYFAYLITFELCKMIIYSDYRLDKPWNEKEILYILGELSRIFDHNKDIMESLVKETAVFEQEPLKLMQVLLRLK